MNYKFMVAGLLLMLGGKLRCKRFVSKQSLSGERSQRLFNSYSSFIVQATLVPLASNSIAIAEPSQVELPMADAALPARSLIVTSNYFP